jgi:hypothetical protein
MPAAKPRRRRQTAAGSARQWPVGSHHRPGRPASDVSPPGDRAQRPRASGRRSAIPRTVSGSDRRRRSGFSLLPADGVGIQAEIVEPIPADAEQQLERS